MCDPLPWCVWFVHMLTFGCLATDVKFYFSCTLQVANDLFSVTCSVHVQCTFSACSVHVPLLSVHEALTCSTPYLNSCMCETEDTNVAYYHY